MHNLVIFQRNVQIYNLKEHHDTDQRIFPQRKERNNAGSEKKMTNQKMEGCKSRNIKKTIKQYDNKSFERGPTKLGEEGEEEEEDEEEEEAHQAALPSSRSQLAMVFIFTSSKLVELYFHLTSLSSFWPTSHTSLPFQPSAAATNVVSATFSVV